MQLDDMKCNKRGRSHVAVLTVVELSVGGVFSDAEDGGTDAGNADFEDVRRPT